MSGTSEGSENADVVQFLLRQHQEVRQLFTQLGQGGGEARREPFQRLVQLLAVHETAEEEVVYPVVRSSVPDGGRLADARTSEEDEAKKALSELEQIDVTAPEFDQKLEDFPRMVTEHAENEERLVFPRLRESQDPQQLLTMTKAVQAPERLAPFHPHPHGPESAVGNIVVGPFVAIVDKVRDAIRNARQ